MAKQSYSIKGTNIANGDAVGNQIEQTVSVDDNILPAPQELAEYQKIDPKIVDFLIKSSEREQQHRHKQDEKKLKILNYNEHKVGRMNWWGMFFAFLAIVVTMGLAVITAKRKACGIKNEMRFSDGKTKCAIKKHPSNETWMLFC